MMPLVPEQNGDNQITFGRTDRLFGHRLNASISASRSEAVSLNAAAKS
jgi:hypothetical protein